MNADTQNDANAGDMQRKQMRARKTMQANVGMQNDANAEESKCIHAKRGNCNGEQMHARKTRQIQKKTSACTQNDANAEEKKCMHAK